MEDQRCEVEVSSSTNRLPGFLAGLLLGSLAGAAAMLLFAPRTGKETRAKLQKQGAKLRHQAAKRIKKQSTQLRHEATERMTDAGDKAHEFTDGVQKGIGELQHNAWEMLGDGRN
jgi:gas vesicle protein